jgi:flavodoxin
MGKSIVVFESKWGNTKLVAEKIAEGMKQAGIEALVVDVKDLKQEQLSGYDVILIGTPNHIGGATRNIGKLAGDLGKLGLDGKTVAFFDTCMKGDYEKVVKKLEKTVSQKAPGMKLIAPGLSIIISGMKGPVPDSELAKCTEFGTKIAKQIQK